MDTFESFKDLYQDCISCNDLDILNDFYYSVKSSGKYEKMIAFVYKNKKDSYYNIISNFADLIGELNVNVIGSFKIYEKRPQLIVIPEMCKGKNKKVNESVRNLLFYEQPLLYGGSFIKGVFNADILQKTHIIYME